MSLRNQSIVLRNRNIYLPPIHTRKIFTVYTEEAFQT